jgi:hypothetical protein
MDINQQFQILIDEAINYGLSPEIMEKGVNPVLKAFASKLKHLEYYILQNKKGEWLYTTLTHRYQPEREKTVIYAFASYQDAMNSDQQNVDLKVIPLGISNILLQFIALKPVDSIIFLETPGDLNTGSEVSRNKLEESLQIQLQQLRPSSDFA